MDVRSIQAGDKFDTVIGKEAESSRVMLAIIGEHWISEEGRRRLNGVEDYVRRELETGLNKKGRVVPVLIEPIPFLTTDQLPERLKGLASLQALQVTHKNFRAEAEEMVRIIKAKLNEGRRIWDRASFLEAARAERGPPLERRLTLLLDWVTPRYALKWGNGARYGTAQIVPKGSEKTVLSVDTTGLVYIYMNELHPKHASSDRQALVARLNDVQGIAIAKERAAQAFIGFQIGNIDMADLDRLFGVLEAGMAKSIS